MTVQVIRAGASVRVVVQARSIVDTTVNSSGDLIITYSDGTTGNAGYVGSGTGATISNTAGNATLTGQQVSDFIPAMNNFVKLMNGALG